MFPINWTEKIHTSTTHIKEKRNLLNLATVTRVKEVHVERSQYAFCCCSSENRSRRMKSAWFASFFPHLSCTLCAVLWCGVKNWNETRNKEHFQCLSSRNALEFLIWLKNQWRFRQCFPSHRTDWLHLFYSCLCLLWQVCIHAVLSCWHQLDLLSNVFSRCCCFFFFLQFNTIFFARWSPLFINIFPNLRYRDICIEFESITWWEYFSNLNQW